MIDMPKTIKMNLSTESIDSAINSLKHYKKMLNARNEQFVDKLGRLGEEYIKNNSQYTDCDSGTTSHKTQSFSSWGSAVCNVEWTGEEITFIEFGAGVFFNGEAGSSPHPKGSQLKMLIGKYGHSDEGDKGFSQGIKESWKKPDGEWTHGTPALMPMWRAINSEDGITKMVGDVGREVFDR